MRRYAPIKAPDWTYLWARSSPPAPPGYHLEEQEDGFLGYTVAWRHVPTLDTAARLFVEGRA